MQKNAWEEIWSDLNKIKKQLEEERKKGTLSESQAGVIGGFTVELGEVLYDLGQLEEEIDLKGVGSPDPEFRDRFKRIFNRFLTIPVGTPPLKEGAPNWFLNEVWGYGIRAVTNFLERRAKAIGVESWSLGATVGFPSGVSGTITINFPKIRGEN